MARTIPFEEMLLRQPGIAHVAIRPAKAGRRTIFVVSRTPGAGARSAVERVLGHAAVTHDLVLIHEPSRTLSGREWHLDAVTAATPRDAVEAVVVSVWA